MATLRDVDRTPLLALRPARLPDHAAENRELQRLGDELANPGGNVLAVLAESALRLCAAHSAGISVLEPDGAEPIFRWHAIQGEWARYEGQGLPRNGSPCGITIGRNQLCLMHRPERHFTAMAAVDPTIDEVVLAPFLVLGQPLGTVWVIFHEHAGETNRPFDGEDARVLQSLARFASNAFLLQEQARNALEARDEIYRVNRRLRKILQELSGTLA